MLDATATSLTERLHARIKSDGLMTFHDWMNAALYDVHEGYYCRANRIRQGKAGDYRTAPETTSLFAKTFAHYFARLWQEFGSPSEFMIIEAGAGGGDFANGVLQALQSEFAYLFSVTRYLIDEISDDASVQIAAKLSEFQDHVEFRRLSEITDPFAQGIVFSNELIDAFPVHLVVRRGGNIRELCVALDQRNNFVWTDCELDDDLTQHCESLQSQLRDGQVFEINIHAEKFIFDAAATLARGVVVTVDYGADREQLLNDPNRQKGTLRAFHRHRLIEDILSRPGQCDLTTTIDWTTIIEAGNRVGLHTRLFQRLDEFLLAQGALDDLEKLMRDLSEADAARLRLSAREMILPNGMASAFQILVQEKNVAMASSKNLDSV